MDLNALFSPSCSLFTWSTSTDTGVVPASRGMTNSSSTLPSSSETRMTDISSLILKRSSILFMPLKIRRDPGKDEVTCFQRFRTFCASADAHSGYRMADGKVERTFLRQRTRVRHDCKCIHLHLVVVIKSQRLIDSHIDR